MSGIAAPVIARSAGIISPFARQIQEHQMSISRLSLREDRDCASRRLHGCATHAITRPEALYPMATRIAGVRRLSASWMATRTMRQRAQAVKPYHLRAVGTIKWLACSHMARAHTIRPERPPSLRQIQSASQMRKCTNCDGGSNSKLSGGLMLKVRGTLRCRLAS